MGTAECNLSTAPRFYPKNGIHDMNLGARLELKTSIHVKILKLTRSIKHLTVRHQLLGVVVGTGRECFHP